MLEALQCPADDVVGIVSENERTDDLALACPEEGTWKEFVWVRYRLV